MSIALMTEVWKLDLAPSDKMVLLALADAANDDGVTWMAVKSRRADRLDLLTKCSLSERAVQGAIKRLCDGGYLARVERPGKGVIYTVTPAASAAPQHLRPAANDIDPRSICGQTVSNPHSTSEAKASSVGRATSEGTPDLFKAKKPRGSVRSRFVPDGWQPTPAHVAKAAEKGLDLAEQAELFRNHEFRDGKSDFDRAFHTWLTNAAGRFAPRAANQNRPTRPMEGYCALDQAMNGIDWDAPPEEHAA